MAFIWFINHRVQVKKKKKMKHNHGGNAKSYTKRNNGKILKSNQSKSNLNTTTVDETLEAIQTENKHLRRALNLAANENRRDGNLKSIDLINNAAAQQGVFESNGASTTTLHKKYVSSVQKQTQSMNRINDQIHIYQQKVKKELSKISAINKHISETRSKMLDQRKAASFQSHDAKGHKNVGHDNYANSAAIKKQIYMYENRLNQALIKLNQKVAQNKQLRKKIDDFKQERVVFDGIYKKLELELSAKSKQMSEVIEQGKYASMERDRVQKDLISLKKKAYDSKKDFELEWEKLGSTMMDSNNNKINSNQQQESSNLKAKTNTISTSDHALSCNNIVLESSEISNNGHSKSFSFNSSSEVIQSQLHCEQTKDVKAVQQSLSTITETQMKEFDEAMEKLKDATGLTNIDDIINTFLEREEKNFSLFNYVTHELNDEIEELEQQIDTIKKETEKAKAQGASFKTQKKKTFKKLDEKKTLADKKAEGYEQRYQSATNTIHQMKSIVQTLFSKTGCVMPKVDEKNGNATVSESNIIQYLSIIEKRSTEIMQQTYTNMNFSSNASEKSDAIEQKSYATMGLNANDPNSKTMGQLSKPQLSIHVEPPTSEDFSSGEESDQADNERPLTREELQLKTTRGMKMKLDRGKRFSMKRRSSSFCL